MSLYEDTLSLLKERKGDWRQISKAANIDYNWITSVAQGRIKNPGVITMQALHDFLKNDRKMLTVRYSIIGEDGQSYAGEFKRLGPFDLINSPKSVFGAISADAGQKIKTLQSFNAAEADV